MKEFRLSGRARDDLDEIGVYAWPPCARWSRGWRRPILFGDLDIHRLRALYPDVVFPGELLAESSNDRRSH